MINVHPEFWTRFPGMRILYVAGSGLDNTTPNSAVQAALAAAQDSISEESLTHPNLQAWQAAYQGAGISMSKYPCSVYAMVKRIAKGGRVPSINPLVDFYNSVSIGNITPLGGMDTNQLEGDQQLRETREGEQFRGIGAEQADTVQPGEICYSDNTDVVTRHFCWRQAQKGSIQPSTSNFILISEIPAGVSDDFLESIRGQLLSGLKTHFGVEATSSVIREA